MRLLFIILTLLFCGPMYGQKIDSLKEVLQEDHVDADRVQTLQELGIYYRTSDTDEAIRYFREANILSRASGDSLAYAQTFNDIAITHYYANRFDSSLFYYFKALSATNDSPEFDQLKSRLYHNIGWDYQKRRMYNKAVDYIGQASFYAKKADDIAFYAYTLNSLGVTYKNKGQYDSAEYCLKRSLVLNRELGNKAVELYNLNNLAVVYMRLNDLDNARAFLSQALTANYARGDSMEVLNNLTNIGELLIIEGNFQESLDTLQKALLFANALDNAIGQMNVYDNISVLREKQGNYKEALIYRNRTETLQDSLFMNEIANYELDFRLRVEKLRREKQEEAQRLYSTIITLSLISAFAIIFILIRFYLSKQKNEQKLIRLNEEIQLINHNLEQTVEERTRESIESVRKVNKFAYVNAHKLRGPLASMLGLIELLNDQTSQEEREKMILLISDSAREIDRVVNEIAEILSEENSTP